MNKEIITFDDIEMEKQKFHYYKNPILINDADIDKILISNKVSLHIRVKLGIMFQKISRYVKSFDKGKYVIID